MEPLDPGDPQRIGEYAILGRLGSGGMGQVFLGQAPDGGRVAVKVMHEWLARDASFRSRFRQEVEAVRRVGGAFTAPVVASDPEDARPWLATAFVAGPSLADAVERNGPMAVDDVLALAAGLAQALIGIHRAGVLHRDLKPSNVLLGPDGPRVIDFGIARAVDATRLTGTGLVVGTPGFMAPEQILGQEPTAATDVFCLGAMLCYASTGASPFGSGTAPALMYRVVHGEPDLDRLPARLRPVVAGCLAKDPTQRPSLQEVVRGVTDSVTRVAPAPDGATETIERPETLAQLGAWSEPAAAVWAAPNPQGLTAAPDPALRRRVRRIAAVTAGVLVIGVGGASIARGLMGGGPPRDDRTVAGAAAATTRDIRIGIGLTSEPLSYNVNTFSGSDPSSLLLANLVFRGFTTFDGKGKLRRETDFGTVTKISDSPLTVRYVISSRATWSDGVPVTCDDAVLTWLANANVTGDNGFETAEPTGYASQHRPACVSGAKEFTVTYAKPSADWEAVYGTGAILPSHVVEDRAGLERGQLVQLAATPTSPALAKAITFYNSGWNTDRGRPATALLVSNGPYVVTSWTADALELTVNPRWRGTPPRARTFVFRFGSESELVGALRSGRINVLLPLTTSRSGVVSMRQVLQDFSVAQDYDGSATQSLVFNFASAYSDLKLRRAVALCVPRQKIVDELIKPVHGKAEPLRARIVPANDARYEEVAEAAEDTAYAKTNVAASRRLLEGTSGGIGTVLRLGWNKAAAVNERSERIVELIKQSCGEAGFDVQDVGNDKFYSTGLTERKYDVALLGWDGRPTPAAWSVLLHTPRDDIASFDYGGYSSDTVDGWLDELAAELDPDRQVQLLKQIERRLSEDVPTVPLYAVPGVVFLDKKVTNVVPNGTVQGLTWDADAWDLR